MDIVDRLRSQVYGPDRRRELDAADEIERLRAEKERRIHWQDLAYAGMRVIDAVAGNRVEYGHGVTEDDCKTAAQMAIDKVTFLKAENGWLRAELKEARKAVKAAILCKGIEWQHASEMLAKETNQNETR